MKNKDSHETSQSTTQPEAPAGLLFENGFGAFDPVAGEYRIHNSAGKKTPMPWINIMANPEFGALVTQSGATCTWFKNSYLFRLTPWVNDPVTEQSGEMLYVRDEETFAVWSPTPAPLFGPGAGTVRHGHGYTVFESESHGLRQSLRIHVSPTDPIKFFALTIKNQGAKTRKISASFYVQWLLGDFLEKNRFAIEQQVQVGNCRIIARNPLAGPFSDFYGFAGTDQKDVSFFTDRTAFFGRNERDAVPEMLHLKTAHNRARITPNAKPTKANDPCAVLQVFSEIAPGAEVTMLFYLGADTLERLNYLPKKIASYAEDVGTLAESWQKQLSHIRIQTPNQALNVLWNEQLLYQLLNSRLWGRVGLYQPGGAFGFRDQLQDVMALVWSSPEIVREHILLAASRQFTEGDVQHWWHPPLGQGVRSTLSDPHLWLVYAAIHYASITGDKKIWDEQVPYLSSENPEHRPGQYFIPAESSVQESLYEHCVRAIELTVGRFGVHGLPLMLAGDWNDSLNKVGAGGKGESVWLAFFLGKIIKDFSAVAEKRSDALRVEQYNARTAQLAKAVAESSWDGNWYLRAFWDDGRKLGSAENSESKIDSLSQSWAVISGLGDTVATRRAMESVEKYLVHQEENLISVLTPPFEQANPEPGYVTTYPPGMRENGGSYTHAALWVALAETMLGNGNRAMDILDMSNPFIRSQTFEQAKKYAAEPYVLASDIATMGAHAGKAGWTWYTGSAGVYYTVVLENVLGIRQRADRLFINPCVPKEWENFSVDYTYKISHYTLHFENPEHVSSGVSEIIVDGEQNKNYIQEGIPLQDDGKKHVVKIVLGLVQN